MTPEQRRPHLLLVDDVPSNLQVLVESLPEDAFKLQVATSGADALTLLQVPPYPDLILLDIMMPDMNGYAVCREIKRRPSVQHIPVIFVTALDEARDEVLGFEAGAVDYITKPFDPEVVEARIRLQLKLKFASDQLRRLQSHVHGTPSPQTRNLFHKRGAFWDLRFQGGPLTPMRDLLGLNYLDFLLHHPGKHFSVEELVFLVSPSERAQLMLSAAEWIDAKSMAFYHQLSTHIVGMEETLGESPPPPIATSDIDQLLGELRRIGVLGSDTPNGVEHRDRYRKSVGNAIRRAIKEMSQVNLTLASHLQHPNLRLGHEIIYAPDPPVTWGE